MHTLDDHTIMELTEGLTTIIDGIEGPNGQDYMREMAALARKLRDMLPDFDNPQDGKQSESYTVGRQYSVFDFVPGAVFRAPRGTVHCVLAVLRDRQDVHRCVKTFDVNTGTEGFFCRGTPIYPFIGFHNGRVGEELKHGQTATRQGGPRL